MVRMTVYSGCPPCCCSPCCWAPVGRFYPNPRLRLARRRAHHHGRWGRLSIAAGRDAEPAATSEPTVTPLPTFTPMPLPPPRLLDHSPAPGEAQPLDAPLELIFDQPMDRATVEDAFVISPAVQGGLSWADDRTVAFALQQGRLGTG